jgi:pimeloyl-ACP methyl ester carboxylesterase
MALKVDGNDTFGPGPSEWVMGGETHRSKTTAFPGRDGERLTDFGAGSRRARQTGILIGQSYSGVDAEALLQDIRDDVDALVLDGRHAVTDQFGRVWSNMVLVAWKPLGPRRGPTSDGASWRVSQAYEAEWAEIPEEPNS